MRIKLILKHPFDKVFGFDQTETDVSDGSTIADVMRLCIAEYNIESRLVKDRLIDKDGLKALYAINKETNGGTIVKDDYILSDNNSLTVLGSFIGG